MSECRVGQNTGHDLSQHGRQQKSMTVSAIDAYQPPIACQSNTRHIVGKRRPQACSNLYDLSLAETRMKCKRVAHQIKR